MSQLHAISLNNELVHMKIKKYHGLAIIVFCVLVVLQSFKQPGIYKTLNGKISFKSEAPHELINAASGQLVGLLDASKNNFAFKINMRSFHGFNNPTQEIHFNENYMESDRFPDASFKGKIIEDVDLTKDGSYSVRAKGTLSIHGVDQERIIKSDVLVSNGAINIKSNFTVLLSDYNIPIPRVVYQKLANEILVGIDATLEIK